MDQTAEAAPPAGLARRAVRGGAVLAAARLLVQVGTWAVTFLVARLLEPGDYGVMTWGTVFLGLAEILAEAGVGRALVHKDTLGPDDVAQAFTVSLMLAGTLYAGFFLSAGYIAAWLDVPPLALLLRVLGLTLLLAPLRSVSLALLDREQRIARQAAIHVLTAALQSALVLGLAWGGAGYSALAVGAIAAGLTETLTLALAAGWWPRLAWPGREGRELVSFGMYVSGASFLWYFYSNADFAVVGRMFGPAGLGYYALAFQLMSIPVQRLTANVNQVAYPVFCRLKGQPERLRGWYLRLTVLLGAVGLPALVGMALTADDAFLMLLSEKWAPAVPLFRLLSLAGAVQIFGHSLPPLFNALGRPDLNFRYTLASVLIYPPAFALGGYLLGVVGVCLVWLALYPLMVAGLISLTRHATGIGLVDFVRAQLPVVLSVAVMAAAVFAVRWAVEGTAVRLAASILAGAAAYTGTLLLVGRETVVADALALVRELRGGGDA